MPQTFDPSKPFTMADSGFDPSKPFTPAPASTVTAVSPTETDNPTEAQTRGFKEGVQGGAKGYLEGLADSPKSFAEGIAHLLTTNPVTSVKEAIDAIRSLPDAIRQAGNDPEAWGQKVGNQTGQTMIGMAAPTVIKAGASGVAGAGQAVANAGSRVLGAVTDAGIGPDLAKAAVGYRAAKLISVAQRLKDAATAAPGAAAAPTVTSSLLETLTSGEPIPAAKFFELLKQVPPNLRAGVLEARRAATEAAGPTVAVERPPAGGPLAAQQAAFEAQTPPPAAAAAPAEAPAPPPSQPAARPIFKPGEAMDAARAAFKTAGETPGPAEVSNAAALMKFGKSADDAVAAMIAKRPAAAPLSPIEQMAKMPGVMSDAEVQADMRQRAMSGQKTLMAKYAPDVSPAPTSKAVTLYHNSPDILENNKPGFDAFYGDEKFMKSYPNEFGPHTYKVELPASANVLDLDDIESPAVREFTAKMAEHAWPKDKSVAAGFREGEVTAWQDLHEAWTNKSNVLAALRKMPGYDAVKYHNEYVLPKETSAVLKGTRISGGSK